MNLKFVFSPDYEDPSLAIVSMLRVGAEFTDIMGRRARVERKERSITWVKLEDGDPSCYANCALVRPVE